MSDQPGGSGAGSTAHIEELERRYLARGVAIEQLRADLEAARSDNARLQSANALWAASLEGTRKGYRDALDGAKTDLAQARARIGVLTAALEQVRDLSYRGNTELHQMIHRAAYRALDAAQAAQQPQHASDTTPAHGDLQSPAPRQDTPEH